MFKGTIKRLSRFLGRHAREVLELSDNGLLAAAADLPSRPSGHRSKAMQLARKLIRLRGQRPAVAN